MQQRVYAMGPAEIGIVDGLPTIRGECDLSNAAEIECWLNSFGRAAIDVDLSGVTFFGAAALRALLAAWRRNPNLRIVEPSPIVRRVLDLSGTSACLVHGHDTFVAAALRRQEL
jgi:anti-anti-sigma factor